MKLCHYSLDLMYVLLLCFNFSGSENSAEGIGKKMFKVEIHEDDTC